MELKTEVVNNLFIQKALVIVVPVILRHVGVTASYVGFYWRLEKSLSILPQFAWPEAWAAEVFIL